MHHRVPIFAAFRAPHRIVATAAVLALSLGVRAQALPGDPWIDLGSDLAGTHGSPLLEGEGLLVPGSKATVTLSNVLAQSTSFAVVGLSQWNVPFKGGNLVPSPDEIFFVNTGGTSGVPSTVTLSGTLPTSFPDDTDLYVQFWILDPAGPFGFAASNALQGTSQTVYDLMSDEIDGRLANAKRPDRSMPIFDVQDPANDVFTRNHNCWTGSVDLTGLSPWNQYDGPRRAGTLISPRHLAFAKHYSLSTDPATNEIWFVTDADVIVKRHVVAVAYPYDDIGIAVLDADVPPEITFYKVLPRNWQDHLPDVSALPMLHLDQEEKAIVRDMGSLSGRCTHRLPDDNLRQKFAEDLIGGDSGNPAFVLVDGEALLVLTHYTAVHGPFYTAWFDEVNAAMASLGGGYSLTEFDLDAYLQR